MFFYNPLAYTDLSGFLSVGGSQYSTNNAMTENARLRAMYSDAADAIYAAANASGAGNMYGIWEEGKLSIYTYSDIGNFREIGSVNEAMRTNVAGENNNNLTASLNGGFGEPGPEDPPDFFNGEGSNKGFVPRGNNISAMKLFYEFLSGNGPEKSLIFGDNNPMIKDLKQSYIVNEARIKYIEGGCKNLINENIDFSLYDAFWNATTMTEQFIGGARVSIINSDGGLWYMVNDTKDNYSLYYHMPVYNPSRTPGQITPHGVTHQRYIWFEPYKK